MGLILLEALAAGIVLVLIVWWTMFSGRKGGELEPGDSDEAEAQVDQARPGAGPSERH
jgi:hypothetical protein